MKPVLVLLFLGILLAMQAVTAAASLDRHIVEAAKDLWPHGWFRATLVDAYFDFLTFYVWVAYGKKNWMGRPRGSS